MRLNGWVRLGIVASILWVLVAGWWYWHEGESIARSAGDFWRTMCDLDNKEKGTTVDCEKVYKENFEKELSYQRTQIPVVALLPLPIFWLFVSLALLIWRWVARGFKRDQQ